MAVWTGTCVAEGDVATIKGINCVIRNLVSPMPAIIALAALGMLIYAGIRLISAGADPKQVQSAWNTFTYAIIGIILLAAIWLIFVAIEKFTGAPVTQFGI